ncbi:excinuclease ABC subunit UvrA [Psychrobacillus sp. FSL W7-1457]|uniref:excinuclease ABC subunit UvrA n=1 Tax=Psychrobacillus sp. FSL W7-1457 TaxID=2954547 RepID=UPI00315AF06A
MTQVITIENAYEGNLKNISLQIPRNKLVCVTGVSGSGKSTLVIDTLYKECQRQYLEATGYQGIQKPGVDHISNLSPAIQINQHHTNKNPRSTVGTMTNIYTDLRVMFEKISQRTCGNCHHAYSQNEGKQSLENIDGQYVSLVECPSCQAKEPLLTRTHFSYNKSEGACPTCSGIGEEIQINWSAIIDETKSIMDGALLFLDKGYQKYVQGILRNAFQFYQLEDVLASPVETWTQNHKTLLYKGVEAAQLDVEKGVPKNVTDGRFEGIEPMLWRKLADKGIEGVPAEQFATTLCSACHGERLNEHSRRVTVYDKRLPELVSYSIEQLSRWIHEVTQHLPEQQKRYVDNFLLDIQTKTERILKVGVGYLTLDRQTITLSGGEQQKIKLAAVLDSTLTGVIYLLDEPTTGLHPKDTKGMIELLRNMRDLGNTVIVIEHDPDVMKAADLIIDVGPGAGKFGGEVIGIGNLEEMMAMESSVTGQYLQKETKINERTRQPNEWLVVENVTKYNLNNVTAQFPMDCFTAVVGASGSGKSTLVFDVMVERDLSQFNQVITVEQSPITKMKRSNIATYTDAFSIIRTLFSKVPLAKEKGFTNKHFSFNTAGGRCENCEGLGVVPSNMLFFDNVELVCPACNGKRFKDEVLEVTLYDKSISQVLDLSVEEAGEVFKSDKKLTNILNLLQEVGLGYVTLGQPLTTLSGGEGQRLKLAKELLTVKKGKQLFLIDEPTTGLHPIDIEHFLVLLQRIVDAGNTVIVVEHNEQVIRAADWIIEMGPEGGMKGGKIIATGTPAQIMNNNDSIIREYI